MRRNNRQLRLIADTRYESTKLTDVSGNPSEHYYWTHMAAVRRELQDEFWAPQVDAFEVPLAEIRRIETQVRTELYP